jgi:type II secretory pathway component HofQ
VGSGAGHRAQEQRPVSRQLDGNVLRIATVETLRHEAEGRRAQIDAEALAVDKVSITRFLSYAHAKDLLLPLKKFLSQRGDIVADERTNSIVVADIPAVLPQIDRIIQQMDRKTQEVEIEARVVAATRSFARDIGVQLGLGWGNGTTAVGGAPNVGRKLVRSSQAALRLRITTPPVAARAGVRFRCFRTWAQRVRPAVCN